MLVPFSFLSFYASAALAHFVVSNDDQDMSGLVVNSIPYSTRVKYMRLVCLSSLLFCLSFYSPIMSSL
jgi:hypothetical protein